MMMKCAHFLGISSAASAAAAANDRNALCIANANGPMYHNDQANIIIIINAITIYVYALEVRVLRPSPALTMQLIPFAQVGHRQRAIMSRHWRPTNQASIGVLIELI